MSDKPKESLLKNDEAAEYLKVAPTTLNNWRSKKKGPFYCKLGRGKSAGIRYRVKDLQDWLDKEATNK